MEHGLLEHEGELEPRPAPPKGQKKSLGKLSQQFLQLFLAGIKVMSLTDASDKILGTSSMTELEALAKKANAKDPKDLQAAAVMGLKTKIRRLYDIAQVFCNLGLTTKIEGDSRRDKPRYQWSFKLSAQEIREERANQIAAAKEAKKSISVVVAAPAVATGTPAAADPVTSTPTPVTAGPFVATTFVPPPTHAATNSSTSSTLPTVTQVTAETNKAGALPPSGTPVCDKKLMAMINARGAEEEATDSDLTYRVDFSC